MGRTTAHAPCEAPMPTEARPRCQHTPAHARALTTESGPHMHHTRRLSAPKRVSRPCSDRPVRTSCCASHHWLAHQGSHQPHTPRARLLVVQQLARRRVGKPTTRAGGGWATVIRARAPRPRAPLWPDRDQGRGGRGAPPSDPCVGAPRLEGRSVARGRPPAPHPRTQPRTPGWSGGARAAHPPPAAKGWPGNPQAPTPRRTRPVA